ncbi:lipoprotein [Spiroplasma alleghenense]|uniref:Lipoprotein n=1 Tax=Spiroplasma alleghenense TaxID=216931 RepID=A0A345Z3Q3_9MOLU|nr:lipoprotein [Spiroplasma alleghenense]AXK51232.1 hypothetical protein SALLE_v1c05580 [Spiroplasma alleghenense]
MKKLLGLLAAFGLTASAGSAVVACGDNSKAENVKVELTITPLGEDSKDDIEKAINGLSITAEGPKEVKDELSLAAAIMAINTDETISKMAMAAPKVGESTSKENTPAFNMTVTVKFTEKALVKDLSVLTVETAQLGELADNEEATIKAALKAAQLFTDDELKEISVSGATDTEATVKAVEGAKLVKGEGKVSFTLEEDTEETV